MSDRKMVSIPAETHDELMAWLVKQNEVTGFKITAGSFVAHAIQSAMAREAIHISKATKKKTKK